MLPGQTRAYGRNGPAAQRPLLASAPLPRPAVRPGVVWWPAALRAGAHWRSNTLNAWS
ncbi:hypothetical protein NJH83_01190 [Pseudomonas chlororaphis]|uniref:hypothetical protein n=1 Tax=Pseudomonas chlororaphis TaxID=587753 RepID=UPI00209B7889|nr:hypothetical protein [Pseudomonas chlororaphis]MCO7608835.1 hypothetical protein [Pseudomonas chlororaphis]